MVKQITCALACALSFAAGTASAAEHQVFLVEGGFFPEVVFVQVGDTVVFTNTTNTSENVVAADASWATSEIPTEGAATVAITEDMVLAFAYDEGSEAPKLGNFSFDPAPLQ